MDPNQEIENLRREVAALQDELAAAHAMLAKKDAQLERIVNTFGWRMLSHYGRFKYGVLLPALGKPLLYRYGRFKHRVLLPALDAVTGRKRAPAAPAPGEVTYEEWTAACERVRYDPGRAARRVARLARRPLVSVITPVYNTPPDVLDAAIRSVRAQLYPEWELCLHDDASPNANVLPSLQRHAREDPRIRVSRSTKNAGISSALNGALSQARGEYVAFLDHDDALTPDALLEMAVAIDETGADILYSDEDKLDPSGRRFDPFFKPGWSPDLMLSLMYTCHLTVCRRDLVEAVGGFRPGFEGSQDYDLWLRMTERTEKIAHVPLVLYHWRQVPGSTAVDTANKSYAHERSRRAIGEALARRGVDGVVEDGPVPTSFRVVRRLASEPTVSVIIPTRDRVDLLARAVEGVEKRTDYRNVEVIIVDNGSSEPETLEYLRATPHRVIRDDGPFNFSRLNNEAAAAARGDLLLLLNNDTEPLERGWLRAMVEHGVRPQVGVVGAKLLYPSGKVQHAGVVLGIGGVAGHGHKYSPGNASGYYHAADLIRNFSAVTGACLLVRRSVFEELGGLDERNLAVAFNDVDFCLRARERGYLVVWSPHALLTHFESESRGFDLNPREIDYMIARWGETLIRDPYYSPNLTLVHEDFSFDLSKPDGYVVGAQQQPLDHPSVELSGERVLTCGFRSTHDGLAGVALYLDAAGQRPVGISVRLSLRPVGGPEVAVQAEAPLSTATPGGDLYVLFDEPLKASRAAFSMALTAPGAVHGHAPRLRTAAPDSPAFRLLHR
jgi:GT2 family glycosyltransferase